MGFGSSSPPKEDPAVAEMRRREQERAEAEKLRATQSQLREETSMLTGGRGARSLLGPLGTAAGRKSLLGGG